MRISVWKSLWRDYDVIFCSKRLKTCTLSLLTRFYNSEKFGLICLKESEVARQDWNPPPPPPPSERDFWNPGEDRVKMVSSLAGSVLFQTGKGLKKSEIDIQAHQAHTSTYKHMVCRIFSSCILKVASHSTTFKPGLHISRKDRKYMFKDVHRRQKLTTDFFSNF